MPRTPSSSRSSSEQVVMYEQLREAYHCPVESAATTRSGVRLANFTPPLRHNVVSNPTVVQSPHPSGLAISSLGNPGTVCQSHPGNRNRAPSGPPSVWMKSLLGYFSTNDTSGKSCFENLTMSATSMHFILRPSFVGKGSK